MEGLNTAWDDYNMDIEAGYLSSSLPLIFSSNRHSSGGEFNIVQGKIGYSFGQTTGSFTFYSEITNDAFFSSLTEKFNTDGNDYGPYRFFSTHDGQEYMTLASESAENDLDVVFSKYPPYFSVLPAIPDPVPATVFNSNLNDAYLSLNSGQDTAYFCSDRGGDYNIYMLKKPAGISINEWFSSPYATPVLIDSLASDSHEKCPFIIGRYMVFVSDRPDGYGNYDIYYSVLRGGKWSAPVNMGPGINTDSNEFRPVVGTNNVFDNHFMIFSSDRPGGKGRYDLYFAGLTLE